MNKLKTTKISIAAASAISLLATVVTPAFAQINAGTDSGTRSVNVCELLKKNPTAALAKYEARKPKVIAKYEEIKTKVDKMVAKLDQKGVDTTKLKADSAALQTKIDKLVKDADAVAAALKANQDPCPAVKLVQQDMQAIQDYFTKTIKPDIQAVQAQLKSMKASARPSARTSSRPSASSSAQR